MTEKTIKAFALIFCDTGELTATHRPGMSLYSIFHTRKDALARKKEIVKSIKTKIVPITLTLPKKK